MKKLKNIRIHKGLSVRQVADKTGYSQTFIQRVESGKKCSSEKIDEYAAFLGCRMVPVEIGKSYVVTIESDRIRIDYTDDKRAEIIDGRIILFKDDKVSDVYETTGSVEIDFLNRFV